VATITVLLLAGAAIQARGDHRDHLQAFDRHSNAAVHLARLAAALLPFELETVPVAVAAARIHLAAGVESLRANESRVFGWNPRLVELMLALEPLLRHGHGAAALGAEQREGHARSVAALIDDLQADALAAREQAQQDATRRLQHGDWAMAAIALIAVGTLLAYRWHAGNAAAADSAVLPAHRSAPPTTASKASEIEALRERAREDEALRERAREDERLRLARELHDELGSTLVALKCELSGSSEPSRDVGHPARRQRAATELVDHALGVVRDVVDGLRPMEVERHGLWGAIRLKAGHFERATRIACELDLPADLPQPPLEQASVVFRIVEESLTNVARHAGASRVRVRAQLTDAGLEIAVADDGRGICDVCSPDERGHGLQGMHERVQAVGGRVLIGRGAVGGTTVSLQVPLPRWDVHATP
jgi:signal transduction histidine kinase